MPDRSPDDERILFITYSRIGDAVLSTGALDLLVRRHPHARVTVACSPLTAPLFTHHPNLERIIALRKRRHLGHWRDLWKAAFPVRWDLVVDLRRSAISWLLLARQRLVADKGQRGEHRLTTLARLFDAPVSLAPTYWVDADARARADALLGPHRPVVAVAPTANARAKVWPAANYAALIRRLIGPEGPLADSTVLVTGGPGERELARHVLDALPEAQRIDAVGLDLPTTAAAFARCGLYVGNDSGLTHLAAAVGTPTVALFGPTDPAEYGPTAPTSRVVRTPEDPQTLQARARSAPAEVDRLMANLTVDDVERSIRDLLGGP